jgi:hypothetical protein
LIYILRESLCLFCGERTFGEKNRKEEAQKGGYCSSTVGYDGGLIWNVVEGVGEKWFSSGYIGR